MLAFSAFVLLLSQIEVVCSIDTVATYFAANSGLMATDVFGDLADGQLACLAGNIVSLFCGQLCVAHVQSFLSGKVVCYRILTFFVWESVALVRRM